jgi:hypothetical protein
LPVWVIKKSVHFMMNMGQKRIIHRDTVSSSMKRSLILMIYSECSLEEDCSRTDREGLCTGGKEARICITSSIRGDTPIMMRMGDRCLKTQDWLCLLNSLPCYSYWLWAWWLLCSAMELLHKKLLVTAILYIRVMPIQYK